MFDYSYSLQSNAMNRALLFWQLFWSRIGRASQSSSCFVLMAFLQARRASFRRLASSEFHQMLSFLRSDFRIGQAASYELVITKWTVFASTSMSSFEEGTGTGRKIRSFSFCSSSFTYLFQHLRRTLRNILACFWILLLTRNLIYMWSENDGTSLTCQPTTQSHAHRFTKVKSRTSSCV